MKKRDIFLDFTSLLDVTLIVIFFFVLFSHLDSEENKVRTNEAIEKYNVAIQEAEDREMEAEAREKQLDEEIEIVKNSNARTASNVVEMLNYNRNDNLKIILDMNKEGWKVRIIHNEELIECLSKKVDVADDLLEAMEEAGYSQDQTIFCDFTYDGSEPGTRSAYKTITDGLSKAKKKYKYLYISETDLSVGKEE